MSKDLLQDRYGRFYEIPTALQKSGHKVFLACISYRDSSIHALDEPHPFLWKNFHLGLNPLYGIFRYYRGLCDIIKQFQPDVIVGSADSFNIILSARVARKFDLPYIVDLYDNFESYGATSLPGIKSALSMAVRNANGVSPVSEALKQFVVLNYKPRGFITVIENAIVPELFHPTDKALAREKLKLPKHGCLIGTAGALYRQRGIDIIFEAFNRLVKERDDIYLVLAGSLEGAVNIPSSARIIYLGELAHEDVPKLFNALDLGVICNIPNEFGLYCFPQKAYEMLACELPVVAADVGAVSSLFADYRACLYAPGDNDSLLSAIKYQLRKPQTTNIKIPSWEEQGDKFSSLIEQGSVHEIVKV